MRRLPLIVLVVMASPAFAETPPSAPATPSAPVHKAAKTDFTKPFIDDRLVRQLPPPPVDQPSVELKAGPATK